MRDMLFLVVIVWQISAQPILVLPEQSHDFGTVKEGEVVVHPFAVENRGDSLLYIKTLGSSCPCATIDYVSEMIQPDGSGAVQTTLRTEGLFGEVEKELYLESNDPKVPFLSLTLRGTVVEVVGRPNLVVKPGGVWDIGIVAQSDTVRFLVSLRNNGDEDLTVNRIVFQDLEPALSLSFPLNLLPAHEVELLMTFESGRNHGIFHRTVKIEANGSILAFSLVGYIVSEYQIKQLFWLL